MADLSLFSIRTIVSVTKGRVIGPMPETRIGGVKIDSRKCLRNDLFVPLAGGKTDGHRFILDARKMGAAATLMAESFYSANESFFRKQATEGFTVVVVPDVLKAMQKLAAFHVASIPGLVKIGITGSNGKTTTKEILGSILRQAASTFVNIGNYNSDIGLPLSVFGIDSGHTYAVQEMGVNYKGEMATLVTVFSPDIGILTNIGSAHIGSFGSREAIAAEKGTMFAHMKPGSMAVLHRDEPFAGLVLENFQGTAATVPKDLFTGIVDRGVYGYEFTYTGKKITFPLAGTHHLQNAYLAVRAAELVMAGADAVKTGLESVTYQTGRGEIVEGNPVFINDCYNANPDSMTSGLNYFERLRRDGRKIVVLGSMKELGEYSEKLHGMLGRDVAGRSFDAVFLFGEEMKETLAAARENGYDGFLFWSDDFAELREALASFVTVTDTVYLKGSHSMDLERLLVPAEAAQGV